MMIKGHVRIRRMHPLFYRCQNSILQVIWVKSGLCIDKRHTVVNIQNDVFERGVMQYFNKNEKELMIPCEE